MADDSLLHQMQTINYEYNKGYSDLLLPVSNLSMADFQLQLQQLQLLNSSNDDGQSGW
jgi:hypothetical protein